MEEILKLYGLDTRPIFRLENWASHYDFIQDQDPYLKTGSLNSVYLLNCLAKAIKLCGEIIGQESVALVYENLYSGDVTRELEFLSRSLGIGPEKVYKLNWDWEGEVYSMTRYVYRLEKLDRKMLKRILQEIILSDLGGKYDFSSKIFLVDRATKDIFHLYDDRGAVVYSLGKKIKEPR